MKRDTPNPSSGEKGLPWLTPGREVVVIRGRDDVPSDVLTIERVLARDVVLSDGDRWNRNNVSVNALFQRTGGAWDVNPTLHAADSPVVARAREKAAERRRKNTAWSLADQMQRAIRRDAWADARDLHARLGAVLTGNSVETQ